MDPQEPQGHVPASHPVRASGDDNLGYNVRTPRLKNVHFDLLLIVGGEVLSPSQCVRLESPLHGCCGAEVAVAADDQIRLVVIHHLNGVGTTLGLSHVFESSILIRFYSLQYVFKNARCLIETSKCIFCCRSATLYLQNPPHVLVQNWQVREQQRQTFAVRVAALPAEHPIRICIVDGRSEIIVHNQLHN